MFCECDRYDVKMIDIEAKFSGKSLAYFFVYLELINEWLMAQLPAVCQVTSNFKIYIWFPQNSGCAKKTGIWHPSILEVIDRLEYVLSALLLHLHASTNPFLKYTFIPNILGLPIDPIFGGKGPKLTHFVQALSINQPSSLILGDSKKSLDIFWDPQIWLELGGC